MNILDELTVDVAFVLECIDNGRRDDAVGRLLSMRDRVSNRVTELLQTIVRLTNEVPFKEEMDGWMAQRGKMLAEVGTLKARVAELELTLIDKKIGEIDAEIAACPDASGGSDF